MSEESLRAGLVDGLAEKGMLVDPAVESALRSVPRHLFLPGVDLEKAYGDHAVVTKTDEAGMPISSASQPAIVALMLQQLELAPGQRVLEIGAGTGYNAALLSHIVGAEGKVTTVDIDPDVTLEAWESLGRAGVQGVEIVRGDGGLGWPEHAPYDRIIVTVGAWDLPPAWFEQLTDDGRLVVPLNLGVPQRSIGFEKANGRLRSRSVLDCGFMRMRGDFAGPGRLVRLGPGVTMTIDDERSFDVDALTSSLARPSAEMDTGVTASQSELFGSHALWLALTEPDAAWISVGADAVLESGLDPPIQFKGSSQRLCMALQQGESLALPIRSRNSFGLDDTTNWTEQSVSFDEPIEFEIRGFGPDGLELAIRLAVSFRQWELEGRPTTEQLQVEVYPRDTPDAVFEGRYVVDKRHCRLAVDWAVA